MNAEEMARVVRGLRDFALERRRSVGGGNVIGEAVDYLDAACGLVGVSEARVRSVVAANAELRDSEAFAPSGARRGGGGAPLTSARAATARGARALSALECGASASTSTSTSHEGEAEEGSGGVDRPLLPVAPTGATSRGNRRTVDACDLEQVRAALLEQVKASVADGSYRTCSDEAAGAYYACAALVYARALHTTLLARLRADCSEARARSGRHRVASTPILHNVVVYAETPACYGVVFVFRFTADPGAAGGGFTGSAEPGLTVRVQK